MNMECYQDGDVPSYCSGWKLSILFVLLISKSYTQNTITNNVKHKLEQYDHTNEQQLNQY